MEMRLAARRAAGGAMSDARCDMRTPDGECDHFCWPGLPHVWAEWMLRLIEQETYGLTDGLHG